MKLFRSFVVMVGVAGVALSAWPQDKPETKADHLDPSPYDMVQGWLKDVPQEWMHIVATYAESPNRIFVLQERHLGQNPRPERKPNQHYLVVVNRDGEVIEEWSQWDSLFSDGHKVSIDPYDPQRHVWVLGRDVEQVMEFTNDGKRLVMALGTKGEAGSDDKHFNRPTDIAWFPDRSFVVSDGDTGRRVVKFDKNGKYLTSWSTEEGPLAGYNTTSVHGIAIDANRRVYVAARNAKEGRIIVFDENGKFLSQWKDLAPVQRVFISQDGFAWIQEGDNVTGVMAKYDLNGKRLATYVIPGTDMTVDSEGNLYSQNFQKGRNGVDKYVPKKGTKIGQWVAPRVGDKKYVAR